MNLDYVKNTFGLEGKNAVVSGASQGIGKAVAASLAGLGAHVTLLGRNRQALEKAVCQIRADGGQADWAAFDVTRQTDVDRFFDDYLQKRRLDIFVNNAAYSIRKRLGETLPEDVDGLIQTNVKGAMFGLQRAAAAMKAQRDGNIVIVTSVNALAPLPTQAMYSSTKAALETMMRCLAADLAGSGVRVNSCAPGAVDTQMNAQEWPTKEKVLQAGAGIPLQRVAAPEEIGDVVACMVSPAFRYMTGSTVLVDGGLTLRVMPEGTGV